MIRFETFISMQKPKWFLNQREQPVGFYEGREGRGAIIREPQSRMISEWAASFLCFTCSIFFFFLCACFNHALTFRFVFKASVGAFFYNSVDLDDVRRWRWLRKRKRQRQRRCQLSLHAVIREAAAAATTTTMLTHLEYVERDSPAPSIRLSVRLIDQLPLPSK